MFSCRHRILRFPFTSVRTTPASLSSLSHIPSPCVMVSKASTRDATGISWITIPYHGTSKSSVGSLSGHSKFGIELAASCTHCGSLGVQLRQWDQQCESRHFLPSLHWLQWLFVGGYCRDKSSRERGCCLDDLEIC